MLNADGFTRWWNPTEFTAPGLFGYTQGSLAKTPVSLLTATVNPYKYFASVLGPTDSMQPIYSQTPDSSGDCGVFSAGTSHTREYKIQFPMNPGPVIKLGYAIAASWAPPTVSPPANIPHDFPISANQPEAFYIAFASTANSLYYDKNSGAAGGVLRLLLNVHDWQGMQAGANAPQVGAVEISSPDLFSGTVNATLVDDNQSRAQYSVDLSSKVLPTKAGNAVVVVRVESKNGPSYKQGSAPAPTDNISAFKTLIVPVAAPDCVADANNSFADYINFDLSTPIVGQLCAPTDYEDFYRFQFDPGFEISGNLVLDCNEAQTRMELYDKNQVEITEADATGGKAVIDLGAQNLMPDPYYIRVVTQTTGQAFQYMLEFTGKVTDTTPKPVNATPPMLYFDLEWAHADGTYAYFTGPFGVLDLRL